MIIAGRKASNGNWDTSSYRLLDIGQSGDSGVRLSAHDRVPCWNREKPENSTVLYKFAAMPSANYDETDRRIVECCLRAHEKPPCGTECNEGYGREDVVSITNTGKHMPLKETYKCP